jgi:hypothetical protein
MLNPSASRTASLEVAVIFIHIRCMTEATVAKRKVNSYSAAGRTSDGVIVLRPAKSPKHFTLRQIEGTVEKVKRLSLAGKLPGPQAQKVRRPDKTRA